MLEVLRQDFEEYEAKLEELIANQLGAESQVQRRKWLESNPPVNDNDTKLLTKVISNQLIKFFSFNFLKSEPFSVSTYDEANYSD